MEYSTFISLYPQFETITKNQFDNFLQSVAFYGDWGCYQRLIELHLAHLAQLFLDGQENNHYPVKMEKTYESAIEFDTSSTKGSDSYFSRTVFGQELIRITRDLYAGMV